MFGDILQLPRISPIHPYFGIGRSDVFENDALPVIGEVKAAAKIGQFGGDRFDRTGLEILEKNVAEQGAACIGYKRDISAIGRELGPGIEGLAVEEQRKMAAGGVDGIQIVIRILQPASRGTEHDLPVIRGKFRISVVPESVRQHPLSAAVRIHNGDGIGTVLIAHVNHLSPVVGKGRFKVVERVVG